MTPGDLRRVELFDGLDDTQLAELLAVGHEVRFEPGDELFREAQPADDWWVLLQGSIDLLRHVGHEETVLSTMAAPGQWAGGFQAWDAHGVYMATGRASSAGCMLRVPATALRERAEDWFPFGVHLIQGLVSTARNIESMARQREALAALGTLAAGLAHEINNPASAASRAVDALEDTSEELLSALTRLARGSITADQFVALDALRREIRPPAAGAAPMDEADREDELSEWLAEHGVEREWLIAPALAAAGIGTDWCERAGVVLTDETLEPGLEWVASSLATTALLAEVKESTRRISGLVASVRTYSQLDRGSVQQTDLAEGLESTLVMLAHKIPSGIRVVREYDGELPRIEAIAGELNQVWTNLVDNAIDAMDGTGTLRVSTRVDGAGVVVEIGDTGPGVPESVRAHVFEPFYTTKEVGTGTGLGLDISRRIVVERHAGEISMESGSGETVLRVRLPMRRATAP